MRLAPLDWNFSNCPLPELPILYNYEFSRESGDLREDVDFIRHGQPSEPTYWSNIPDFGWPEWPELPFLTISPAERQRRIALLSSPPDPITDIVQALAELPLDSPPVEQQRAIVKHIREQYTSVKPLPRNRSASYRDRLRALSVYRLRQHYSAPDVLKLLQEHYRKAAYNHPGNIDRAKREFMRHLYAFVLRAQDQARKGQWFPPFGPYLIRP
jgi:hypothetical protein